MRLILLTLLTGSMLITKASEERLEIADSLFVQQKYTEAFEEYHSVFNDGGYTPSMLLKMAFIQDGLENYADALFFLDLYYQQTADKTAVVKIEEISQENNLNGFGYNDMHFFKALLNRYYSLVQLFFILMLFVIGGYMYLRKNRRPVTAAVFQLIILFLLFFHTNRLYQEEQGIITKDNTLLRNGPSAGAEAIELIGKGHKVKILDKTAVWTKIQWRGDVVYVRNGRIRSL